MHGETMKFTELFSHAVFKLLSTAKHLVKQMKISAWTNGKWCCNSAPVSAPYIHNPPRQAVICIVCKKKYFGLYVKWITIITC